MAERAAPVRIIQLADYGGPYPGSFIPLLRAVAKAAARRGWPTELVFSGAARGRRWLRGLESDGIPVRVVASTPRLAATREIKAIVAETPGPVVLDSHFTGFDVAAALAGRGRSDVAVLWHVQSFPRPELRARLRNRLKYTTLGPSVDAILCVEREMAKEVRRRGAPPEKVSFFPNAIDVDHFRPATPADRRSARKRLGLPAHGCVLLHFGWDWRTKGGDLFLAAAKVLLDEGKYPVVPVTVAGGEPARGLGEELGLSGLVVLSPTDDLPLLYAAADVFVASSRAEGMPFAVAEALCSGVPVVASAIPGHEALGRDLGACALTALDPESLANGIRSILGRGPEAFARDAAGARERMRRTMDLDRWAERLVGWYVELISPLGRGGTTRR